MKCDYCKKSGGSGRHMKRHEERCTMNPDRVCRVCNMIEAKQKPIVELLSMMPKAQDFKDNFEGFNSALTTEANAALVRLRELAEGCPSCVMAAIRQSGIPVLMVTDFDWSKEMQSIWDDIHDLHRIRRRDENRLGVPDLR